MYVVPRIQEFPDVMFLEGPSWKALMVHCWFDSLLPSFKTKNNLELLRAYFLIPQSSVRCFVLMLLARITGDTGAACSFGLAPEAEYLLAQYTRLPTEDMRDKMLAVVLQICAANCRDKEIQYETRRKLNIFFN